MGVIGTHLNEIGCKTLIVNGVEDHVHCLFQLIPKLSISDVMKIVKANSSLWLNSNNLIDHRLEWQSGFAAFSISLSDMDSVFNYILNQEAHHKKITFKEEYLKLLRDHDIDFNPNYLFRDLE